MEEISYGTIWVCVCCYAVSANGECCDRDDHGGDGCEPMSEIGELHAVPGMGWEDHEDGCLTYIVKNLAVQYPELDWPDVPDDYECDCERDTYSTSQCEGCGSYLHGERHAMTLFGPAQV